MGDFRLEELLRLPEMLHVGQGAADVLYRPVVSRNVEGASYLGGYPPLHDHLDHGLSAGVHQIRVIGGSCRRLAHEGENQGAALSELLSA